MRHFSFILYDNNTEYIADLMCREHAIDKKIFSENLEVTESVLRECTKYPIEYFYIICTHKEIELLPNIKFTPDLWDSKYVHYWNNDTTVRLYSKSHVISNIEKYTDKSMINRTMEMKNVPTQIFKYPKFDIAFLSYDESFAEDNFNRLKSRFNNVFRVQGVKGIFQAHKEAAMRAETDMFYVVDADAEILHTFNFDYQPHSLDRLTVHTWHSINPVNNLEYGYGGVKLFPTKLLRGYTGNPIDFTTSVSKSFKVMPEISNITRFDTDPFSAWRSGFRECAKLASKIIYNQDSDETEHRLNTWCSIGNGEYGEFVVAGAIEGRDFGFRHKNEPEILGLINDYTWLEKRFSDD